MHYSTTSLLRVPQELFILPRFKPHLILTLSSSSFSALTFILAALPTARTITARLTPGKPAHNHGGSASYSGVNSDSVCRTVYRTGTALHTQVFIFYPSLPFVQFEYSVWANFRASSAADTFFLIDKRFTAAMHVHLAGSGTASHTDIF